MAEKNTHYEKALAFLEERTTFGINLGLQRIEKLLEHLGNPHQQGIKYLHVGGTNGKGSTVAMLASILQASGFKVGVFTSPHLHSYTERMVINGKQISQADVVMLIEKIKPILNKIEAEGIEPPTEFEVNTAMTLQYFTDQQVDYAIIEVGMGGDIDSTNVILPVLSVITNVEMDHMDYLGNTHQKIAQVKAGIIKPKVKIITGSKNQDALEVIRQNAKSVNAPLLELAKDFCWDGRKIRGYSQEFAFHGPQGDILNLEIKLIGQHQLDNGCLAIAAALELGISEENIKKGLLETFWQGRLEVLANQPLVVIDGAHNHHGMLALVKAIQEYFGDKKIIGVLGMLADKEREKALAEILPLLDKAIITKVPSPRAGNWQLLGEVCDLYNVPHYEIEAVDDACAFAIKLWEEAKDKANTMVLTTGSLYMIADARKYYLAQEQLKNEK